MPDMPRWEGKSKGNQLGYSIFVFVCRKLGVLPAYFLLRFVAFYSLFDMLNVLFAAALKGAGDTTYPVVLTVVLAWGVMLVPTYVLCVIGDGGVYTAWTAAAAYIFLVGLLMFRRFRRGHWKSMRVIEPTVPELDAAIA